MMLSLFLALTKSKSIYDLNSPYSWNTPTQICHWGTKGVTNLKSSLKLIQDKSNNFSFLCNLIPYNLTEYDIDVEFSLNSGYFHFAYMTDFCPVKNYRPESVLFDGLHLYAHKTQRNKVRIVAKISMPFPGSHIINNTICEVDPYNDNPDNDKIMIRVSQKADGFAFYFIKNNQWQKCGRNFKGLIGTTGYFSVFGTPETQTKGGQYLGDQRVFSIKASPVNIQNDDVDLFTKNNRKLLRSMIGRNYQKKKNYEYADKVKNSEQLKAKGDKIDTGVTKLMFQILSEITERAKLGINDTELANLLEISVLIKLINAEKKLSSRRLALKNIENDVLLFKETIEDNLTNLTGIVAERMKEIEENGFQTLKQIMPKIWEGGKLVDFTLKGKKNMKTMHPVTFWLAVIATIEAVLFVVFFLVRRKQTKDFKKID
ncbi:hypothetical protein TRFO_28168 [Tritrichomonas foetus]|uniref:Legume-like lectin family protein n=1 Tax=Tritrichomonas foetus TaxID=1144522 RepID=A0A1J4K4B5_9EUKA|nr:hypothetical protein TRFO_28168 [Tritrichomonas foetus]|eukprot:OHT04341.1 hypothetical protein TRFO_28168 [Tritrichomonas foetus]